MTPKFNDISMGQKADFSGEIEYNLTMNQQFVSPPTNVFVAPALAPVNRAWDSTIGAEMDAVLDELAHERYSVSGWDVLSDQMWRDAVEEQMNAGIF